ncbi:MAG: EF-hand domain-containing protein [Catenulisporales bacterium]|jgi:Ca2+-binding EF-hand superfamily protein|nr:EF-hand domain-containing protein [Catenulisporales bacterium]
MAHDEEPTAESLFRMFDEDGDGQITAAELAAALTELGEPVDEAEAAARIRRGDADRDGRISLDEFEAMVREASQEGASVGE